MTGVLGKFHVDHDNHSVRLVARSHRLSANCATDAEIDTAIQMLKDDLDACACEMKRIVALNSRSALFEGWPSMRDQAVEKINH